MTQSHPDKELADLDALGDALDKARGEDDTAYNEAKARGEAMGLGMKLASELLAALIVGGLLGFGADVIFDTKPLFLLGGIALGFAAAFMSVLRMMKKLNNTPAPGTQPEENSEGKD